MIEQARIQYLTELGIDSYVPRFELSGAAASAQLVMVEPEPEALPPPVEPVPEPRAEVETSAIDTVPVAQNPEGNSLSTLVEPLVNKVAEKPTAPEPPPVAVASTGKPIKFVLDTWSISDSLLVIDTRDVGSALPSDRLLQNILWRLNIPLAQLPASETLRWPLFKGAQSLDDSTEARAMVQAYIYAHCDKLPGKTILLMGKSAFEFGVKEPIGFDSALGNVIEQKEWQANVVVLPSLATLLYEPMQKALVWQALSQLNTDHR